MRILQQIGLFALLLLVGAWCAFHFRSDWQQISLSSNAAGAIVLATTLSLVNYALRASRWSLYLSRLGHTVGFRFAAITYIAGFAFAISPGKLGELARARYYVSRGTPFRDLAAIALMERVLDVVAMLVLATLALSLLQSHVLALAAIAVIAAFAVASIILVPWTRIRFPAEGKTRVSRFAFSALQGVIGAMSAARSLLTWPSILVGLLLGLAAWGCEGIGLYVLSTLSTEANIALVSAVGIYAVATIAGAATFLPGGLVGTEAVMTALLVSSGLPTADALMITLICRFVTLWLAVALGWIAVFFLELRRTPACTSVTRQR
jgi:glycosyltransferase 2 family protein